MSKFLNKNLPYNISYDIDKYPFREFIQKIFHTNNIDSIYYKTKLIRRSTDQQTKYHKIFYENFQQKDFTDLYHNFIVDHIRPLYNDKIVIQKLPTFRICYLNNVAVGEFHKDKWYRNELWANKVKELNFFLPFTDAFDTNTIWVESKEDKKDFTPMNCKYGECIAWDGSNLLHGNRINRTNKTRISIDFRVIEYKNYQPSEKTTINTNIKFKIGEYYSVYE